jgi:hypothetical protein
MKELIAVLVSCCLVSCAADAGRLRSGTESQGQRTLHRSSATDAESGIHGGFRVKVYASVGDSRQERLVGEGVLVVAPKPLTTDDLSSGQIAQLKEAQLLQLYVPTQGSGNAATEERCRGCLAAVNELQDALEPGDTCVAFKIQSGPFPHFFQPALAFDIASSRERSEGIYIELLRSPDSSYGWTIAKEGASIAAYDVGAERWFQWSHPRIEILPDSSVDFADCADDALAIARAASWSRRRTSSVSP